MAKRLLGDEDARIRAGVLIRKARMEAGLTQEELAQLIGTTQSSIARLERVDYHGQSLAILQRIAQALERRLVVDFVSERRRPS